MYSINHQVGNRKAQIASFINISGIKDQGTAFYGDAEMTSQLFNNTLTFNKQLTSAFNLSAMAGYEYQKFDYSGMGLGANGFPTYAIDYTDILQSPTQTNTNISSFKTPSSEIQSFFGRVTLNFLDKVIVTGTMRADGSSKFGSNNR